MKKKISMMDVKQALLDPRFRNALPEALQPDVKKFMSNPGCACNHPIYVKVIKEASQQLVSYFPAKDVVDIDEIDKQVDRNNWSVINCTIYELEDRLSNLPPGRKQLDVARWEDQVTVVINDLDIF